MPGALAAELPQAGETHDADLYDNAFAADVLSGTSMTPGYRHGSKDVPGPHGQTPYGRGQMLRGEGF
ncbi:hypothetical protein [Nocardia carnea]|uniref:hypothetical protein n=1 Tax=Nocardia carnea TaxID=37328 RepID=UPI002455907F|nr:hypothetical protein [Nocardia carnea]